MRGRFLTLVVLVGTLGLLAFPGEGSALVASYSVSLTSTGPSPSTLSIPASHGSVVFQNTDTVTHTVTFDDSSCSGDVAPNSGLQCSIPNHVGTYGYTIDGTTPASVTVTPEERSVTLTAKHHGFRRGSTLLLHGTLRAIVDGAPPASFGPRMPVTVLGRRDRNHPWHRIAVVMAKPLKQPHCCNPVSVWHLWVRPRTQMTYRVEATSQPKGGQFWANAQSKPFGFYVRRR